MALVLPFRRQSTRDRSQDWQYNTIAAVVVAMLVLFALSTSWPGREFRVGTVHQIVGSDIKVTIVRRYIFQQVMVVYTDLHGVVHEQVLGTASLRPVK